MHSTKNESPISQNFPNDLKLWLISLRPKTLVAGISPVLIGACFAARLQPISYELLALCLLFSVAIQIGTNWANDYFDYVKGADTASRKGPPRAVQSGWITPRAMRNAAFGAFAFALLCAIPLLLRIGVLYLPLTLLCPVAGALYTGGKRPLGYLGLGDPLVLIFYGPVAVCCTALALLLYLPEHLFLLSLAPGFLACALLCVTSLRDIDEDRKCGKMTLVARFGYNFGKWQYAVYLALAGLIPLLLVFQGETSSLLRLWWLIPFALTAIVTVFKYPEQHARALKLTSALLALYTLGCCYVLLYL